MHTRFTTSGTSGEDRTPPGSRHMQLLQQSGARTKIFDGKPRFRAEVTLHPSSGKTRFLLLPPSKQMRKFHRKHFRQQKISCRHGGEVLAPRSHMCCNLSSYLSIDKRVKSDGSVWPKKRYRMKGLSVAQAGHHHPPSLMADMSSSTSVRSDSTATISMES